jgi:crotonobetainyl-CoA:carnitine CoA-transferase CaiB-like acyl-CoA transferase
MDEIPELGQDTDAILTELGYTLQQIQQFRQDGVV